MTLDEIRELIKLVTETGVAELEVQRGDDRVRIRRAGIVQDIVLPEPDTRPAPTHPIYMAPAAHAANPVSPLTEEMEEEAEQEQNLAMVKSPIVGTFYEAPSPGAPPFVQVGDVVHPGQVLCIIESMKLMNEIEAEIAGTVVKKFVMNAQPVEYGEALFAVRPQ